MNQIQTEVIFLNLLRQADELIISIVGTNPAGDAGSFRARVSNLFATFQADKTAFVASSEQLGFLATLLKEYAAFKLSPIEQIGTPEILIGQIRWEDIYNKPDILAASSDWADITNKPATFAPSAHGHAYSEITDKPATYPPAAHGHAYSEITGKPSCLSMAAVRYAGNGNPSRVLSFTENFVPKRMLLRRDDNGTPEIWDSARFASTWVDSAGVNYNNAVAYSLNTVSFTGVNNTTGKSYTIFIWGES